MLMMMAVVAVDVIFAVQGLLGGGKVMVCLVRAFAMTNEMGPGVVSMVAVAVFASSSVVSLPSMPLLPGAQMSMVGLSCCLIAGEYVGCQVGHFGWLLVEIGCQSILLSAQWDSWPMPSWEPGGRRPPLLLYRRGLDLTHAFSMSGY